MENKKPTQNITITKNLLEVDLGYFGIINYPGGKCESEFFKSLETRHINKELIEVIREKYNDTLENEIYPEIEKKIKNYLQKISDARCSGDLKKIMNQIADEGLVAVESQWNGKKISYKFWKHLQIERSNDLITAYTKKKNELSKKYNEIISKPNGIRINGRKSPSKGDKRAGSYSLVLTVDFGENKHGQETVRITDFLPVHGPTPEFDSRTYIVGYSVPNWLKEKISEIKQKIKDSKDAIHRVSETETENKDEKEPAETKAAA